MTSTLDNSALSRQLLRPESGDSEGEEYGSGYDDEQCTQPVDPRPLTGNAIPCHVTKLLNDQVQSCTLDWVM